MEIIFTTLTVIDAILFIGLFYWYLNLKDREAAINSRTDRFKTYFAKYTITESDEKYPIGKLRAIAKQRMLGYIARQIGRDLEPTIVSKDGLEVEYQYTIEARRKEVAENPKLVPSDRNVYEGIWKEAQK